MQKSQPDFALYATEFHLPGPYFFILDLSPGKQVTWPETASSAHVLSQSWHARSALPPTVLTSLPVCERIAAKLVSAIHVWCIACRSLVQLCVRTATMSWYLSLSIETFKSRLAGSAATQTSIKRQLPCFYLHFSHVFVSFYKLQGFVRCPLLAYEHLMHTYHACTIWFNSDDSGIIGKKKKKL